MISIKDFKVGIIVDNNLVEPINIENQQTVLLRNKQIYSIRICNNHNTRTSCFIKIDGKFIGNFLLEPFKTETLSRPSFSEQQLVFVKQNSEGGKLAKLSTEQNNKNGLIEFVFSPEKMTEINEKNNSQSRYFNLQHANLGLNLGYSEIKIGVDTVGSSKRNSTYDISNETSQPKFTASPWQEKSNVQEELTVIEGSSDDDFHNTYRSMEPQLHYSSGGTGLTGHSNQLYVDVEPIINIDYENAAECTIKLMCNDNIETNENIINVMSLK